MNKVTVLGLSLAATLLASCHSDNDSQYANADAYIEDSQYSHLLKACISADSTNNACGLSQLPFIGMEYDDPTIDQIMERVVVSHDWMGENFRQILTVLPDDILTLLKAVTAIVIDDDIRPSYYYGATAAIYLDPATLWLTDEDKNVISRVEDYRAHFSDPLSFRSSWRYVLNDSYAWQGFSLDTPGERQLDDIILPMAQLLYHELAHANDFAPPSRLAQMDRGRTPWNAITAIQSHWVSTQLTQNWPLTSQTMFSLANVAFRGEEPGSVLATIEATEVGAEFDPDLASDFYSYTSPREDVAMLFEELMMKYHFDVDRDIAFTDDSDSRIIGWGVRNRAGDPSIQIRAEWLLQQLLPDLDTETFFASYPEPVMLQNVSWWNSLTPGAGVDSNAAQKKGPLLIPSTTNDFRPPAGRLLD